MVGTAPDSSPDVGVAADNGRFERGIYQGFEFSTKWISVALPGRPPKDRGERSRRRRPGRRVQLGGGHLGTGYQVVDKFGCSHQVTSPTVGSKISRHLLGLGRRAAQQDRHIGTGISERPDVLGTYRPHCVPTPN